VTDYGRPLEFGGNLIPVTDPAATLATAKAADEAELDLVGVQDHPYNRRHFDTWTLISALAPQTSRVRFVTDVVSLPLRPPAVLAKSAATLDLLTGGRVEIGLGAGGFWDGIAAMGGPRRSPGEATEALAEAIEVMRLVWSNERAVSFEGRHYHLHGLHPGPQPLHRIEIWLGAQGPRMLSLTGRSADGWIPSLPRVPPDRAENMMQIIDEAARASGREERQIRRAYNIMGVIGGPGKGFVGPVERWVEALTGFVRVVGMDTFMFWPASDDPVRQLMIFGHEVAPAVRAAVETERSA
jgi:alkanesulfonate monooxygenase SsuD/methylene tetrahydromethanopterin reductase-like flavin-dependent oxidoreductase (luciferase family)